MPNLNDIHDIVETQIGTFVKGRWDYIGLAQLYPKLEVLGQLVPRKESLTNYEQTVLYQTATESTGHGAKPGDPIQPVQKKNALKRKVKCVKYVDSIGWTLDQDSLQGKSDEHIVRAVQMDLVGFDLHHWQDLEHGLLKKANVAVDPDDDQPYYGFPAHVTDNSGQTSLFELKGGDDPYSGVGRPGGISVSDHPGYTNPTGVFDTVSDDNFFKMLDLFLEQRKMMGAVPNPRLLPDTPNDIIYGNLNLKTAISTYLTASNENIGMDAGRYRGMPSYKGIPIVVWHAMSHVDSPVRVTGEGRGYLIDWNSFRYGVAPEYDRKITGPEKINLVPSGVTVWSELWHQLSCDRPDRNLFFRTDTPALQE